MTELGAQDPQTEQSSAAPGTEKPAQGSLVVYTLIALGLALVIRFFVAAPYIVQGDSMMPAFQDLNYLIIDRVTYNFAEPQRGDIVVFDLPQNGGKALIKRIIGVPQETVIVQGNSITIINEEYPQGFQLEEPYVEPENLGGAGNVSMTLGEDEFFVLGDNRKVSADSRIWGVLPREDIVGRVFLRLFPVGGISIFPGVTRYQE